ncbi:unnamed protein product [Owenia fusiformis]|uniref:Uncharacterized protein n=1 Tax=Owenia fusiformis TaxID=6347 RepID=A0A8J1Y426_OWEFU|nr:unnamed protein product [Owenia fusiformis]
MAGYFGTEQSLLDEEILGHKLSNVLLILGVLLALLICIWIIWNYCSGNETKSSSQDSDETQRFIIAQEVQPGLLVIKSTYDHNFRIMKEYEEMSGRPVASYGAMAPPNERPGRRCSTTYDTVPCVPQAAQVNHNLIEIDNTQTRPPPYAQTQGRHQ